MAKIIGRQFQFGVSKESTRGTIPGSVEYWQPFTDLSLDEKKKFAVENQSFGIIEDSVGQAQVMRSAEGSAQGLVGDQTIGLLLLSLLGTDTVAAHNGESSVVYDHTLTVQEGAQHQSLSYYVHDPASGQDYAYANGVVEKLELAYELDKFITFNASIKALTGTAEASYTTSTLSENHYVPQYLTLGLAQTAPALIKTFSGTGTAASTIHVTAVSGFNCNNLAVGMLVSGANITPGTTVAAIVSATAFDMSAASTGNASDLTIGGLIATGTASSTIHVTALTGLTTVSLQVGMQVLGKYIPAGTTIVKIVSSTAFDLSAASTGAVSNLTFGPATVKVKSAKLTINQNIEAQQVLGSLDPVDYLNKQFSVEGQIEAIWQNETDFKTAFMAPSYQAISLDLVNSDVTIGSATNPELRILLAKCRFTDLSRPIKVGDLIYQTIKFKAVYSISDAYMIQVLATNTKSAY